MPEHHPKHRANKLVRTKPRVQQLGKHVGEYVHEDRTHERLGALLFDITVANPFRGRS